MRQAIVRPKPIVQLPIGEARAQRSKLAHGVDSQLREVLHVDNDPIRASCVVLETMLTGSGAHVHVCFGSAVDNGRNVSRAADSGNRQGIGRYICSAVLTPPCGRKGWISAMYGWHSRRLQAGEKM